MEIRLRALGLSLGVILGFVILLMTWFFLLQGMTEESFTKLQRLFIGYSMSWAGSIIGFIWGFIYGFVGGVLIAWLYNKFSKMSYKPKK